MADAFQHPEDPLLAEGAEAERLSAAARLFDVRRVIGGLFVVYGVIVTAVGIFDSASDLTKAQGVRINLWMGLAMLALGLLFLAWQWWRPAEVPADVPPDAPSEGGPRH
jgi:sulfite exporter TauE/SafE